MKVNFAPRPVLGDAYSKMIHNNIKDSILVTLHSNFIDKTRNSWCSGYQSGSSFNLCSEREKTACHDFLPSLSSAAETRHLNSIKFPYSDGVYIISTFASYLDQATLRGGKMHKPSTRTQALRIKFVQKFNHYDKPSPSQ